jgi:hypothetical protein
MSSPINPNHYGSLVEHHVARIRACMTRVDGAPREMVAVVRKNVVDMVTPPSSQGNRH